MLNQSVFKLLAVTIVVGCASAQSNCGSDCSLYTLAFDDEFDGTAVNQTIWNHRFDQKDLSLQTENNVVVSGGYANILLVSTSTSVIRSGLIILLRPQNWEPWLESKKSEARPYKIWKYVDSSTLKDVLPVLIRPVEPTIDLV
jgi:hypothetical protein